jgi:hypothetical protein
MYLYNNQHNALIQYFILCVFLTRFGLTYSPSSRGYVYNGANGDCLLKCRLSLGQDVPAFVRSKVFTKDSKFDLNSTQIRNHTNQS